MKINEILLDEDREIIPDDFCKEKTCPVKNKIRDILACIDLWQDLNWWETEVHECNIHWSCKIKINNIK